MIQVKESVLKALLKNESSEKILLNSFNIFLPNKKNLKEKGIIVRVCLFPSYFLICSHNIVSLFGNICDTMLNVFLLLFGILFTGYVFFQALLNDNLLIMLIISEAEKDRKEKSKLEEVNNRFVSLMVLYIIAIIISLTLTVIVPCIPEDFILLSNIQVSNVVAFILILMFYVFSAELLWRVLSFVRNIYLLFNAYAVSRLTDLVEIEEDD